MKKIDYGLRFYTEVFKLDALHFGYWEGLKELTLENMRKAQAQYTKNLMRNIPAGVRTILDAGCGTGSVARKLKDAGFEIEGISPDEYQQEIFTQKNPDIKFHLTKFEDFKSEEKYDLVLFSESFQYMKTDEALEKCREILKPEGHILICDYFRRTNDLYYKTCKVESEFLSTLKKHFFSIEKETDITEHAVPTLRFANKLYSEHGLPALEIISGYLNVKFRFTSRILGFLFKSKLKKIRNYLYTKMADKLNDKKFSEMMRYKLFVVKG